MPSPDRQAAKKAYDRAYGARYRAAHPYVRITPEWSPLSARLVQAVLSIIPEDWRTADALGNGAYLWHCQTWHKVDGSPFACACGQQFFVKED